MLLKECLEKAFSDKSVVAGALELQDWKGAIGNYSIDLDKEIVLGDLAVITQLSQGCYKKN